MPRVAAIWLLVLCLCPRAADAAAAPTRAAAAAKKVSVSFESADLRAVVTGIAAASGLNVVGSDKLTGAVTVRLDDAPALESLVLILRNAGFSLVQEEGDIYRIAPRAEIEMPPPPPLIQVHTVRLQYVQPEQAAKLLVPHALSDAQKISQDPDSGYLIISGTVEEIAKAQQILEAIDTPPRQVAIVARLVEVKTDRAKSLGFDLTAICDRREDTTTTLTFDLSQESTAANTLVFSVVNDNILTTLDALVQKDVAEVLSAPNVTTTHGREAVMKITDRVPVITRTTRIVDQVTVTDEQVSFEETGVTLTVTPRVLGGNRVALSIEPSVKELTGYTDTDPPAPIIDTRSTTTEVTMQSGKWLVIGGMIRHNESVLERGVPLLKDLPWIGRVFTTKRTVREKSNLIVLVSATVLDDEAIDAEVRRATRSVRGHSRQHGLEGIPVSPPGWPRDGAAPAPRVLKDIR